MRKVNLLIALVVSLLITHAARAEEAKNAAKDAASDRQSLRGTWKVVKKIKNGQSENVKDHPESLTFSGDSVTHAKGDEKAGDGTFALDEAKTPKRITFKGTGGAHAGTVFEAIYELKGDTLRIAYGTGRNAKTPPKDFTGGEGEAAETLQRQKP